MFFSSYTSTTHHHHRRHHRPHPITNLKTGVALCTAEAGGLVCVDYDAVGTGAEEAGTNGRFLALEARLADAILLNVWSSDVGRTVPYNTLALQVCTCCLF